MNNFKYVAVMLDLLYGIELEDDDLEELGLLAWGLIGNKRILFYRFKAKIDPIDLSVTLPCNALLDDGTIEAVTTSYEDWKRVTNYSELGDSSTAFVENSIESEKLYPSNYYISGKLLKYHQSGEKLYFTKNYGIVNILYKGTLMDEEGLPQITDKEATAIATYIAWITKFKEGLSTNNNNTILLALVLNSLWNKQCDLARVTYLNLNDINNILDIVSSYDRHNYNKSSKIIK